MKLNNILFIATALVTLSLIPQCIAIFHLINNGGLGWPMLWGNEVAVWSAIFSLFAVLGLFMAITSKKQAPIRSTLLVSFASIIIVSSIYNLASSELSPASKGDDEKLNLLSFWGSGWWK